LSAPPVIRGAERRDVPLLLSLIRELAEYERAAECALGTEALLEAALFGPDPVVEAVIAERDGAPVAFALFYRTFSTWQCLPGLYLEDLYVRPEHRRDGIGGLLLGHLAVLAVERGYGRMEWSALTWNTPALSFYERLGAERLHEWDGFRLEGEAIARLAQLSAGA
jgi:GNAT superfamily N-acetyltransferase